MFKRVKSLLVSGLLVMGMAAPAFANNDGTTRDTVIQKYKIAMQNIGSVSGDVRTIGADEVISELTWLDFVDEMNEEDDGLNGLFADGSDREWRVYFDANFNNDLDEGVDVLIETVKITFNEATLEGKGNVTLNPATGDIGIAVGAVSAMAAAGGALFVVNKKRK